jgi:hypothetical protein
LPKDSFCAKFYGTHYNFSVLRIDTTTANMTKNVTRTQEKGANYTQTTTTTTKDSGSARQVVITSAHPAAGGPRQVQIDVTKSHTYNNNKK